MRVASKAKAITRAYVDTRPRPRLRLPKVIQFPVNDICNSHCEMCFIWEQKRGFEVSSDDVRRILSDPLFREVTDIGINGGEPTLRKDLAALVEAAGRALPKLRGISLITNAIQTTKVIEAVRALRVATAGCGLALDVMVSLDGLGEVHDRVRGRKGNFESAIKVLQEIRQSNLSDSVRVGCTLTATNAKYGQEVLEWCIEHEFYARFRVAVPHNRLYNRDRAPSFLVPAEARFHLVQLFERLVNEYERSNHRFFYRSLVRQLAYNEARSAGCAWRNHGVTLLHDGSLAYCAVESPNLGSALKESASDIYWRNSGELKSILDERCASCVHDYDGPSSFLEEIKEEIPARYGIRATAANTIGVARRIHRYSSDIRAAISSSRSSRLGRRPISDVFLLTGWYGTETVGDQAILASLLDIVTQHHDGHIAVASLEPYVTARTLRLLERTDVEVVDYPGAAARAKSGAFRAVAMAGGPLMGTIDPIRDLAAVHLAAARASIPTAFLGCGIGPMGNHLRQRIIKNLLQTATRIILRDEASAVIARKLGRPDAAVSGDPALIWLKERLRDVPSENKARSGGRTRVGIALRSWPTNEYGNGAVGASDRNRLETQLAAFARKANSSFDLVPINMGYLNVGGDDRRMQRAILGPHASAETRLVDYPTPDSVLAAISSCDVVVAMRYHAALFGIAAGRRVIAIDYTLGGKLAALAQEYPAAVSLIDPRNVDADEISRHLVEPATALWDIEESANRARDVLATAVSELATVGRRRVG